MESVDPAIEEHVRAVAVELSLALEEPQLAQLARLSSLLAHWNERMNLTGHRSAAEVVSGLIADALALSTEIRMVPRSLADLGSGAGFPGLPLAILFPQCACTLVEARERRVHFQREAIRRLGLENTRALVGRAEALQALPSQLVTVQAVAAPEKVLALAEGWVEPGGVLAIPSSERVASEARQAQAPITASKASAGGSGGASWEVRRYRVPGRAEPRALLLMRYDAA